MISQRCPKCQSNRIRRGYRPTPFWSKILCRYRLLCDNCNWEFIGFAVPGTVGIKSPKKSKKTDKLSETLAESVEKNEQNLLEFGDPNKNKIKVRKRVKLKL